MPSVCFATNEVTTVLSRKLMPTKVESSELVISVPNRPTLAQLHENVLQVLANPGCSVMFTWTAAGGAGKFCLALKSLIGDGNLTWQLHSLLNGTYQPLWFHESCDIVLIHNLIASSCGDAGAILQGDGVISASPAHLDDGRPSEDYFVRLKDQGETAGLAAARGLRRVFNEATSATRPRTTEAIAPKAVDRNLIRSLVTGLKNPETDLFSYQALLFFLEQEYFRSQRNTCPFSLLLINLRLLGLDNKEGHALNGRQLNAVGRRIAAFKRQNDMLAHYDSADLAILLPQTGAAGAKVMVRRVIRALLASPLPEQYPEQRLTIAIGGSSMPDECTKLGVLLAIAEKTLLQSCQGSVVQEVS